MDIAEAGGHRLDVLLSRYAHALPGGREALAAGFDQVLERARVEAVKKGGPAKT